jgi:hypothetical protein
MGVLLPVGWTSGRGNRRGLDGFTERFEDTLNGIHLGDERRKRRSDRTSPANTGKYVFQAMIRIGSSQRGQESGKTCILGGPSRPILGPGFHRSVRPASPRGSWHGDPAGVQLLSRLGSRLERRARGPKDEGAATGRPACAVTTGRSGALDAKTP